MQRDTFTYVSTRQDHLGVLVSHIKAYGLPPNWNINVAGSSVIVTSPDRRQVVKTDIYLTVDIDRRKGLSVKSERQKCANIEEAWQVTEKTLNSFIGR
jgi:hypothetical protein